MQVYTARRTEKIKGMPLGEEQLTMPHAAAQSCVEEAITFRLLPVWMPALHPEDHSLAQPPSVRRKQWFSPPRKQLPRVVYQLPYRSSNGSRPSPSWPELGVSLMWDWCVADFELARLHTAQLLVKPGMHETTRWRRCQSHGHLTENCIQEVEPAREL